MRPWYGASLDVEPAGERRSTWAVHLLAWLLPRRGEGGGWQSAAPPQTHPSGEHFKPKQDKTTQKQRQFCRTLWEAGFFEAAGLSILAEPGIQDWLV